MPIRFSTEAANADRLIDDDAITAKPAGAELPAPQSTARSDRSAAGRENTPESGHTKAGKDINAAGFVKDKDSGKP